MRAAEAILNHASRLLKERTAEVHHRLETALDLTDPGLDVERLTAVLRHFAGFWAASEPALDAWAAADPDAATLLAWPRRRRAALYRADVAALDRALGAEWSEPPLADPVFGDPVFGEPEHADVLGWLYVAEGSTLGGAVLARRLAPLLAPCGVELRSFTPYAEGPGPMWRAFQQHLDAWTDGDRERAERVAAAGVRTFGALERWVAPLRRDVAA